MTAAGRLTAIDMAVTNVNVRIKFPTRYQVWSVQLLSELVAPESSQLRKMLQKWSRALVWLGIKCIPLQTSKCIQRTMKLIY